MRRTWGIRRVLSVREAWGAVAALLVSGCATPDYMEVYDLPETGWAADQAIVFTLRPDTLAPGGDDGQWIDITVRHRADYPYAELPLEIKGVAPDKSFWTDTLLFPLGTPAENGTRQWAGHAYSNHYDITRRYRNGIRYTQPGEYALSIRQLSGADTLRGILSLGVIAHGVRPAALP
ncbi:hypothetical protein [Millionella massiliensis]|uniref:hypothetical protein n=1 Tax=Millionella massiliensis TaxID=1871023 RepID=UPI0023A79A36|nr:hypothetical protein [Millionella massiliensis]